MHTIVSLVTISPQVLAIDDAAPPRTGTATVTVTIAPENDNAPIITNPPGLCAYMYIHCLTHI